MGSSFFPFLFLCSLIPILGAHNIGGFFLWSTHRCLSYSQLPLFFGNAGKTQPSIKSAAPFLELGNKPNAFSRSRIFGSSPAFSAGATSLRLCSTHIPETVVVLFFWTSTCCKEMCVCVLVPLWTLILSIWAAQNVFHEKMLVSQAQNLPGKCIASDKSFKENQPNFWQKPSYFPAGHPPACLLT